MIKKIIEDKYLYIVLGSFLYAVGTIFFIFPNGLILGGTSGISVIMNAYLPFSSGTILTVINSALIVLAFVVLGSGMAVKSFAGSILTTLFIGWLEMVCRITSPVISNSLISGVVGASILAVASGIMFYVDSCGGGTDIIALIIKKYCKINVGRALLVTDFLIVIVGGALSGWWIAVSSLAGLLVKTFGIDFVIAFINKRLVKTHVS